MEENVDNTSELIITKPLQLEPALIIHIKGETYGKIIP